MGHTYDEKAPSSRLHPLQAARRQASFDSRVTDFWAALECARYLLARPAAHQNASWPSRRATL